MSPRMRQAVCEALGELAQDSFNESFINKVELERLKKERQVYKDKLETLQNHIANVYRKLSLKYHPDRGGSHEAMQAINEFKSLLN